MIEPVSDEVMICTLLYDGNRYMNSAICDCSIVGVHVFVFIRFRIVQPWELTMRLKIFADNRFAVSAGQYIESELIYIKI